MRILVWGLGYVGSVCATCLARLGHEVVGIETNPAKVEALNAGRSAIKEPGLDTLIAEMIASGRLRAAQNGTELVGWADVSLICVGTPSAADGSAMLEHISNVAVDLGRGLKDATNYHTVVLRSTVFPGTTRNMLRPLLEEHSGKQAGVDFGLATNPEFLRETSAIKDFYAPPYTVIGEFDSRSGDAVEALYAGIEAPIHRVGIEESEILKMVNNAFHALKIGFANEIGRVCDPLGIDSQAIMQLVCADTKLNISPAYLRPGFAFGGSCLPKDLRSLTYNARRLGVELPVLEGLLPSNRLQVESVRLKIHAQRAQRVAILGLSFKPGTDDLRESPVISLIRDLWQDGIDVLVHDPDVNLDEILGSNRDYLERQLPQINGILRPTAEEALDKAQTVVITQKRPEFLEALKPLFGQVQIIDLVQLIDNPALLNGRSDREISWKKDAISVG